MENKNNLVVLSDGLNVVFYTHSQLFSFSNVHISCLYALSLSLNLSIYQPIYLSLSNPLSLSLSLCLLIPIYIYLSVYVYQYNCQSIYQSF